jgi:predicted porin
MKKHLIAAAVAAAVAVPAMAQNVNLTGRLDASLTNQTKAGAAGATYTQRSVNSGLLSTPYLRLSGTEDLGGGLRAGFFIEGGLNNDRGSGVTFGDRGALVSLSGGFGTVKVGKMDTSNNNAVQAGPINLSNFELDQAFGGRNRPDNAIGYTSPRMNGFSVNAMYSTGVNQTETFDQENVSKNGRMYDLGLTYSAGPIAALVYTGRTDVDVVTAASDGKRKQTGARVSYKFDVATVQIRYLQQKPSGGVAAYDARSTALDVTVPLGGGYSIIGGYVVEENKAVANSEFQVTNLVLVKDLSKRTNVYAALSKMSNESGASRATGSTANGNDPMTYGVGIRHNF